MSTETVPSAGRHALAPSPRALFSAIVTCHYEEKSIDEFHARLSAALGALGHDYEIIMVNDGSTDGTWEKLKAIWQRDPAVRVILDFYRNYGQTAAITAGLEHVRGTAVVLLDSDLQLAPEELPLLVAKHFEGHDVVSGARTTRRDSLFRIVPSKIANMIMRKASQSHFSDFGCTFKIYDATLLRGMGFSPYRLFSNVDSIARAGRHAEVPITHFPRKYGKSGWTFAKLWKYNMDNVIRLSERPFQLLAVACLTTALLFVARIAAGFFTSIQVLREITPGLLLNFSVVSLLVVVAVLCLVGEFTIRAFLATQRLPGYIVREMHEKKRA